MLYRVLAVFLFGVGAVASVATVLMVFAEERFPSRVLLLLFGGAALGLILAGRACWRRGARQ